MWVSANPATVGKYVSRAGEPLKWLYISVSEMYPFHLSESFPQQVLLAFGILWLGVGVLGWCGWSVGHGGSVCGHDLVPLCSALPVLPISCNSVHFLFSRAP